MKKIYFFILLAVFLRLFVSFLVWHPDLRNHMDWGIRFWQYGPSKFFAPESNVWNYTWPNQPPGTIYIFAAIRKLFEFLFYGLLSPAHFRLHIFPGSWLLFLESNFYPALLKLPAILADFGIALVIYKWTRKSWAALLWLFNPVVWYNSAVWGQTDAIVNFFVLLSFYFLQRRRLNLSVLSFALSLYIKASLLIFAPIWLVVAIRQKYKIIQYFFALVYGISIIGILTFPFSKGDPFSWLYWLYTQKIFAQQLHVITANAFNLWAAVAGVHERPDSLPLLGLTYQYWSYILFSISFVPILLGVVRNQSTKSIVWSLALTAFSSWVLLTNMHERYLYPLFPYLTILTTLGLIGSWYYWLISLISLLNLYNFWWVPRVEPVVNFLSFGDRFMPRAFGLVLFAVFVYLYSSFLRLSKSSKL